MSQIKVLVVDDDARVREVLCTGLKARGYLVRGASCTKDALVSLEEFPAEVLVTDILMPGGNGVALINQIRLSNQDMKILAMSGGGERSAECYLELSSKYGVDRTLLKPILIRELDQVIRGVLTDD